MEGEDEGLRARSAPATASSTRLEATSELDAETIASIARKLDAPIRRLVQMLHILSPETPRDAQLIRQIEESIRVTSQLVRDLCLVVLGIAPAGRPPRDPSLLCGASVLLVGEDTDQVQAIARVLREEGATPVVATSAPECLVRVTSQQPEVVLVDVTLGSVLARMLARVAPRIPMIVTGSEAQTASVLREHPKAYLLDPPFTAAALCGLLEQVLTGPQATAD